MNELEVFSRRLPQYYFDDFSQLYTRLRKEDYGRKRSILMTYCNDQDIEGMAEGLRKEEQNDVAILWSKEKSRGQEEFPKGTYNIDLEYFKRLEKQKEEALARMIEENRGLERGELVEKAYKTLKVLGVRFRQEDIERILMK